jgi:pancreatic lipase-related protein 2
MSENINYAEYLHRDSYNIFFVDWFNLSSSFCYPAVVHNIPHVGACTAQLVSRIRDAGGVDIHVIGFSLGAQVTNYVANELKPDYVLPRITGLQCFFFRKKNRFQDIKLSLVGLDPALPLFITSNKAHKLDPSDAMFVDVFHCNVSFPLHSSHVRMRLKLFSFPGLDARPNGAVWASGFLHEWRNLPARVWIW